MNRKLIVGLIIIAVLLGAAGYKLFGPQEKGITATGTIEVTKADIMPKVSGYITELSIKAGDKVDKGQIVIKIARPDLEAQVLRDKAALIKAKVQLEDLEKGSRSQERSEAVAALNSAQALFVKAKTDYERYTSLQQSGAISIQQLDSAKSAYDVAYNNLLTAQAKQSVVEEGYRPDTVEAQRLEIKRAKAILDASNTMVADTIVVSPISGLVLTKNYELGEYVNPGAAIATIGDMSDCWVKIYISSTQLGLIKVGQAVNVKVDSFSDRVFNGEIKEISQNAEFTPRQSITQRERANLVFAVKVKIDNSEGILKPGMPADVVIK